jgi:hypothetical protein
MLNLYLYYAGSQGNYAVDIKYASRVIKTSLADCVTTFLFYDLRHCSRTGAFEMSSLCSQLLLLSFNIHGVLDNRLFRRITLPEDTIKTNLVF